MRKEIVISTQSYDIIKRRNLFFVKFIKGHIYYDQNGKEHDSSSWECLEPNIYFNFPADNFGNRNFGHCLCVLDNDEKVVDDETGEVQENVVRVTFHDATSSTNDYKACLNSLFKNSNGKYDVYTSVELLWLLDKYEVNIDNLTTAINSFDRRIAPRLLSILQHIGRCLSINNQQHLKAVCNNLGGKYEIYMPSIISELADLYMQPRDYDGLNLFQLIDRILEDKFELAQDKPMSHNPLVQLRRWLDSEEPFEDYSLLIRLFSLVTENKRLEIVKRYFHDIRLGHTQFDSRLIGQFVDNKYVDFIKLRHCIETPTDSIKLTVPLLCDSILTLYNSNGESFLKPNGVLDFAITHCDQTRPAVCFEFHKVLPTCNGGAVYNDKFKGFISFQFVRILDEQKLKDTNYIRSFIRYTLDTDSHCRKYVAYKCRLSRMPISHFEKCKYALSTDEALMNTAETCCPVLSATQYDSKWVIDDDNLKNIKEILGSFMKWEGADLLKIEDSFIIDLNDISTDLFREYVKSLIFKFEQLDNQEFIVHADSASLYELQILYYFSTILRMRVIPQKDVVVGALRITSNQNSTEDVAPKESFPPPLTRTIKEKIYEMEAQEVTRRTIESLKKELETTEFNGDYFELPYDINTLDTLKRKYYFNSQRSSTPKDCCHFLEQKSMWKGHRYCAPKLSPSNNPAIDIPFFWCQSIECFSNALEEQTLPNSNWQNYTLYHFAEILHYPKLQKSLAGYSADETIRKFIGTINKELRKFQCLKCRSCGHLLFPDKNGKFGRQNYFSCLNPACQEYRKRTYINYCYKCKKSIIDSRDTKQCPNRFYVCKDCLSCCDDALYERLAQKYTLNKEPIPYYIKQKIHCGHNDKNQYFCPKCGSLLIEDDHVYSCPNCKTQFHKVS